MKSKGDEDQVENKDDDDKDGEYEDDLGEDFALDGELKTPEPFSPSAGDYGHPLSPDWDEDGITTSPLVENYGSPSSRYSEDNIVDGE